MTQQEITRAFAEIEETIQNARPIPTIGHLQKQLHEVLFEGISDYVDYTTPNVWIRANYLKSNLHIENFERERWSAQIEFQYGSPEASSRDKTALFTAETATLEQLFVALTEKLMAFISEIQNEYPLYGS